MPCLVEEFTCVLGKSESKGAAERIVHSCSQFAEHISSGFYGFPGAPSRKIFPARRKKVGQFIENLKS